MLDVGYLHSSALQSSLFFHQTCRLPLCSGTKYCPWLNDYNIDNIELSFFCRRAERFWAAGISVLFMQQNCKNLQISFDSLELKPWNKKRFLKTSSYLKKSHNTSDIFNLSDGKSQNPITLLKSIQTLNHNRTLGRTTGRATSRKPKTAPHFNKVQPPSMHSRLTNLGVVTQADIAKQEFEERLDSLHLHQNFRTSLQQKKQLMFLKPQMKTLNKYHRKSQQANNATQGLENLKTELYKSLRENDLDTYAYKDYISDRKGNRVTSSSFVEYLTEYEGDKTASARSQPFHRLRASTRSQRGRHAPISVMRQKIRNRYRLSKP